MDWRVVVRLGLGSWTLDVDLEGDTVPMALVGPNGSGKTTLLRTVAGAHRPQKGRIEVGDVVLLDTDRGINRPPEERRVGYVPQGYGLFPHMTVLDNVAFGRIAGLGGAERRRKARALLDKVGGVHLASRFPGTLSGGEKQRVALARALMARPRWLLLDEPMAALDVAARRDVRRALSEQLTSHSGPTWLVTHDVRDVVALGAQVCVLEAGRVVQRGPVEALRADPATAFVAEFVGHPV